MGAASNYSMEYVPSAPETLPEKVSIAPMGCSRVLRMCLQGGGVFVSSGTVSIVNSQVYSNYALPVRAHAKNFPSPRQEKC
jgi:hypothetical protein